MRTEIEWKDVIRNKPKQRYEYLLVDADAQVHLAVYQNIPSFLAGKDEMTGLRWFDLIHNKIIDNPYAYADMKGIFSKSQLQRMKENEEKAQNHLEELRPVREAHNEKHYRYVKVADRINSD